jgi:hypothetical protein
MKPWPSTTGIIRHFGLVGFEPDTEAAALRGKQVHRACHLLGAHESLGDGWEGRHPECHPYLDAYRRFQREHRLELIESEREYRSEVYRFISHPDQIVMLDEAGPVDLELKSGGMPKWCQLQTAGQVLAMGKSAMKRFALQLKPDGSYRLFQHDDFRDLDRFRAMIETYWTVQEFRIPLEEFLDGHGVSNQ